MLPAKEKIMVLKIVLPFLYLGFGFLVGKMPIDIKKQTSYLLTRIIIPLIIIYNISTCRADLFVSIFAMIIMMTVMMYMSRFFSADAVEQLCFFYLNIGWLSLPIVATVWGDSAATAVLSLYIGNSLFGNSIGAGMLINNGAAKVDIKRTLKTPPVAALVIGIICMPFGDSIKLYLPPLYRILKLVMSILGMGVLGMWLAKIKLEMKDLRLTLKLAVLRARYMICILPPAANIIVLETHYCHTGKSAGLTAWGTLLSLVLIPIYIVVTKLLF